MGRIRDYIHTHTNPPVFFTSGGVALLIVTLAFFYPGPFGRSAQKVQDLITTNFGWFYILSTCLFLLFAVVVAVSRWGQLRLGPDDAKPEYGAWSWVSMMFTAGMGIGLVYYGVAEPLLHFKNPATGTARTPEAAVQAMNYTIFHWGLQPWAIYIVLGLAMGYFSYRRGLPLKPAAAFHPIIGDGIYGPIGHLIDILAVFGTLFGLATSIGLGANQIAAGLSDLFQFPDDLTSQLIVIGCVEAVAITSVMLGIDAGIRRLSVINMWLAIALALFVLAVGPTLYLLNKMMTDTGYYLQHLVQTSLHLFTDPKGVAFQKAWTLFYWGWWISWSPFVGMFIARISYGYTIRQFIWGTLLIPTGASIVWFVIFGQTALHEVMSGQDAALLNATAPHAIFVLLGQLPIGTVAATIMSVLAIVVVTLFFATSSDSGSLVVDMLTNGGDPDPIWQQRLFWAVLEGLIAAALLVSGTVSGGNALSALQTAAITTGLPFCAVLLIMCYTMYRAMNQEQPLHLPLHGRSAHGEKASETPPQEE